MSFKVGDLVKLHERWLRGNTEKLAGLKPEAGFLPLEEWRGRVIDLYEAGADDVWGGTELGDPLANVAPPIMISHYKRTRWCLEDIGGRASAPWTSNLCSRVEYTTIPVRWLTLVQSTRQPKNAGHALATRRKPGYQKKKQERDKAIELKKGDDAWFLDARAGDLGDADADFHDAADTREKTLSAATQRDLALARSKRKGGRVRRRRRKRTRRRKKRRTRRRRRKRTRRRRQYIYSKLWYNF